MRARIGLLFLVVSGCSADVAPLSADDAASCDAAIAHVEACVGEAPVTDVCDPAAAEQLLATPCDSLGDAKADGVLSDLLCLFSFDSFCDPWIEQPPFLVTGTVQRTYSIDTVSGVEIRLTGPGHETRSTVSDADGYFSFSDLPRAYYTLDAYENGVRMHRRILLVDSTFGIIVSLPN